MNILTNEKKLIQYLPLILIIFFGLYIRLLGLNWDQGQHLHPDERFLTMVASSVKLPSSISNYFNSDTSALNPNNSGYSFYVYGTFPLLITRVIAQIIKYTSYDQVYLVGRFLSAIFDTLTILLIYLLSLEIFKKNNIAIFSAFLYSICVFPIQQAHFFTVDSFTVFFFTLTILLLVSNRFLLSGIIFGITLANKTSVGIILPFFLLFIFFYKRKYKKNIINCIFFCILMCLTFRIFQPYAFDGLVNISPKFISNINEAHQMITGEYDYPPNIQWMSTVPIFHTLFNLIFVGVGPITFLLFILGFFQVYKNHQLFKKAEIRLILIVITTIFIYHSILLAKYMRYFYPIYPILIIFAGYCISFINRKVFYFLCLLNIIIIIAFFNIYTKPHSRYQASEWICQNIATNSVISSESWDDSLPINSITCQDKNYSHQDLTLYDSDTTKKWEKINKQLKIIDYLVLSSNRLWGSIPKVYKRYPLASRYYQNLFDNNTDFKLIKRIYSYPGFSLPFMNKCVLIGPSVYPYQLSKNKFFEIDTNCNYPGIYFRDDVFEESFTVYDHPQIIFFTKNK